MERLGVDATAGDLDNRAKGAKRLAPPRPIALSGEKDKVIGLHKVAS